MRWLSIPVEMAVWRWFQLSLDLQGGLRRMAGFMIMDYSSEDIGNGSVLVRFQVGVESADSDKRLVADFNRKLQSGRFIRVPKERTWGAFLTEHDKIDELLQDLGISHEELDSDADTRDLDGGAYRKSVRNIVYPFSFDVEFRFNLIRQQCVQLVDKNGNPTGLYQCQNVGAHHGPGDTGYFRPEALTIDHDPSLVWRFNQKGEYKLSRDDRRASFFDTSRLRILCRKCNSSLGSHGAGFYNRAYVEFALRNDFNK